MICRWIKIHFQTQNSLFVSTSYCTRKLICHLKYAERKHITLSCLSNPFAQSRRKRQLPQIVSLVDLSCSLTAGICHIRLDGIWYLLNQRLHQEADFTPYIHWPCKIKKTPVFMNLLLILKFTFFSVSSKCRLWCRTMNHFGADEGIFRQN